MTSSITTPDVPAYLVPVLAAYGEAIAAHGFSHTTEPIGISPRRSSRCLCGRIFTTRNGLGLHEAAEGRKASKVYEAAAAAARQSARKA